ncbi:helix-turn-helix domain-containing protein [Candidatus Agathobaculum pullicola]|uniref:helix-turn-helix domain-containing protein n=1 Tax=Candidatus Agathobaculum pullicola TaxID=2838426 RepID=UPI003F91A264
MTTGEKIEALRHEKGLSQEALGEKLGLSRQAVSKWEADQAVPTMDNLVELSRLFGVPVDTLLRPDEPLPDKEKKPSEGITIAPDGFRVTYSPVLTQKTKWFIIIVALLLFVSVIGNLLSIGYVQMLQTQVENLRLRVESVAAQMQQADTEYAPAEGKTEQDALSDYDIAYDLQYNPNKTVTTTLKLSLSARPKELNQNTETPKFTIQSAGESWTCAAILEQDNSYVGSTEIPLRDAFTVYLTLTDRESGTVRNLLLETVSGLEKEFDISCGYTWHAGDNGSNPDDNVVQVQNGVTTVSGTVSAFFYQIWYRLDGMPMRCHPVSARMVLLQGDTELQSAAFSAPEWDADLERYHAECAVDWTVDIPPEQLQLMMEYTDNYGRVHQLVQDAKDGGETEITFNF